MKTYRMKINGQTYNARVRTYDGLTAKVTVNDIEYFVELEDTETSHSPKLVRSGPAAGSVPKLSSGARANGEISAPLPGVILSIPVKEKDVVKAGDVLVILEAMKMESEIAAPFDGTISKIQCAKGETVQEDQTLILMEGFEKQPEPPKPAKPVGEGISGRAKPQPQPRPQQPAGAKNVTSPMPGVILDVRVKEGDMVQPEDTVVILEAMKMESEVPTPFAGRVKSIRVKKGDTVQEHDVLVELGD